MDNIQKIRDAIASSTQQWINSISSQKLSQNNSENLISQNYTQPTTSTSSENVKFDNMIEKATGAGGDVKLELPPFPTDDNLYVLTVKNNELEWTATEDCA